MEYRVEIIMTPHLHDNPTHPYFWRVIKCCENNWCTEYCGWGKTQDEAFQEANRHYRIYCEESDL